MGKKAALVFQQPQRLHLGLSYPRVQYFACDLDEIKTQWVCEQTTTGHLKKTKNQTRNHRKNNLFLSHSLASYYIL